MLKDLIKEFNNVAKGDSISKLRAFERNTILHAYYIMLSRKNAYYIKQEERLANKREARKYRDLCSYANMMYSKEEKLAYEAQAERFYNILFEMTSDATDYSLKLTFDINTNVVEAFLCGEFIIEEFKLLRNETLWSGQSVVVPKLFINEDEEIFYAVRKNGAELQCVDFKVALITKIQVVDVNKVII